MSDKWNTYNEAPHIGIVPDTGYYVECIIHPITEEGQSLAENKDWRSLFESAIPGLLFRVVNTQMIADPGQFYIGYMFQLLPQIEHAEGVYLDGIVKELSYRIVDTIGGSQEDIDCFAIRVGDPESLYQLAYTGSYQSEPPPSTGAKIEQKVDKYIKYAAIGLGAYIVIKILDVMD